MTRDIAHGIVEDVKHQNGSIAQYVAQHLDDSVDQLVVALESAGISAKRSSITTLRGKLLRAQRRRPLVSALRKLVMTYGYKDVVKELTIVVDELVEGDEA